MKSTMPRKLVTGLVEKAVNDLDDVNHILTRSGPKPRSTSPHAKTKGVEDKNVQDVKKFDIGKLCRP